MDAATLRGVAESLSAASIDLVPYLPYLLQDLWELGSSPTVMTEMLRQWAKTTEASRILDLACGKGAVAVRLAAAFPARVSGVDILPEFIEFARGKSVEYGVEGRCEFFVGDARNAAACCRGFDVVIWGAAGGVLGGYPQTLRCLRDTIDSGGLILLDDALRREAVTTSGVAQAFPSRDEWLDLFRDAGLEMLDRSSGDEDNDNDRNNRQIAMRAEELKVLHREKSALFDGYVQSQLDECTALGSCIEGVTWLLRKR